MDMEVDLRGSTLGLDSRVVCSVHFIIMRIFDSFL